MGNNSAKMTKKDEGKNHQLHKNLKEQKEVRGQENFLQYGIISLGITVRKINVHHAIIVVNLILVILERVGLVIYGVTYNSNIGNLPI